VQGSAVTADAARSGNGQVVLVFATPTTTNLTSSLNPSPAGTSVTFTATVTDTATPPGTITGTPTGTVTFEDAGTPIGTGTLNSSGVATFSTSTLAVGSHTITAVYGGDANGGTSGFLGSTSNTVAQVVLIATSTSLSSSLNPSPQGQSVTFTATVTTTTGTPTGTVTFFDNGVALGSPVTLVGGVATFATSTLSVGSHPITAVYNGDSTHGTSNSNQVNQIVSIASPSLQLSASASPVSVSAAGQTILYTATVTNNGNVTINGVGVTDVPTAPAGSVAPITCSPTTIAPTAASTCTGTYTVTALDIASSSGEIVQTFTAAGTSAVNGTSVTSNSFAVAVDVRIPQSGFTSIMVNTTNTVGVAP
jgi:uncharacterized repeat protein (TIGR01451 family)